MYINVEEHRRISDLLIPAKFSLPHYTTDIIHRQRICKRLEGCFRHRLTLVRAPAGYGKTTVVSDWANRLQIPVAWLSLSQEDNQLPVFLSYLSAALKKANPSFEWKFDETFYGGDNPSLHFLKMQLLNEIDKLTPATVLVLDDYHVIQNEAIHKLIYFLLQNSTNWSVPEGNEYGCYPILISRVDPPFFLSKWRIHQEINEIKVDELKFSLEEARELFCIENKSDLHPEFIEQIVRQTEGWITGLRLALLELKIHDQHTIIDYPELRANNQLLIEYMMEEVIQDLPEDIYNFLLITSITDHFTVDMCNYVCDRQDSQEILERLIRENLFVSPMDDQRGWFRYHQLFFDVLNHQQSTLRPEALQEYHTRAARWLEKNGFIRESLRHWLAAGNTDDASRLLVDNAIQLLGTSTPSILKEMIETLPEICFSTNPWLCVFHVWSYARQLETPYDDRLRQAMKYIESEDGRKRYSEEEIRNIKGNIYTLRALFEARFGEDRDTIDYASRALDILPAEEISVRGFNLIAIAKVYIRSDRPDDALHSLYEAKAMFQKGGNLTGASEALFAIGSVLRSKGELNAAHQIFEQVISLSASPNWEDKFFFTLSYYYLSMIELEWNHNEKASDYFGKTCSIAWIGVSDSTKILLDHLTLAIKLGFHDEADQIVRIAESRLENHQLSKMVSAYLISSLLDYYCLQNDLDKAKRFIEINGIDIIKPGNFLDDALLISLARYYWKSKQYDEAGQLLAQLIPFLAGGKRFDRLIKVQTLYAVVLHDSGEIQEATHQFYSALETGLREGYFETFASYGKPVIELINTIIRSDCQTACNASYLSRLQEISDAISQNILHQQYEKSSEGGLNSLRRTCPEYIGNVLTPKERAILVYLSGNCDQKTIANELHISITTIKTHVSHIYAKLGVHSRMEAVSKARELGFLKPIRDH